MSNSVINQILSRIRGRGRIWVFIPKDFLDLGSRAAVDQALSRLAHRDVIRRLTHGVYDYPKTHPRFGQLSPSPDAVAQAIGRNKGGPFQVSGVRAANALGLTTQVPSKFVYFTNGASRKVTLGAQVLDIRHAGVKRMVGAGQPAGTVLQALRYFGPNGIDDDVKHRLVANLAPKDLVALKKVASGLPDWQREVINEVTQLAA